MQKRREEIETLEEMVQVVKAEGLLLYVDKARELGEQFDIEELRIKIIDQLHTCTEQHNLDVDALDTIQGIIKDISECIYLKLFVPIESN